MVISSLLETFPLPLQIVPEFPSTRSYISYSIPSTGGKGKAR